MNHLTAPEPAPTLSAWRRSPPATLAHQLAARMANVMLTAQVQIAYACAVAASQNAARAADCIERAWPDTPLRSLVARAYREQASQRAQAARDVLARARRTCGLAYAAI
jgi:FixJ family two-component response regulator